MSVVLFGFFSFCKKKKSWDCDSDSLETSPGSFPKHMRDEKSNDSPKCINRVILGPPPRSLSICLCPAQQFTGCLKSLTPLYSAAPESAPVCSTLIQPHPNTEKHLCSSWSCLLPLANPWEILQFSDPKRRWSPGHKGAELTACKRERNNPTMQTFIFSCKTRHQSPKRRNQVPSPVYTGSS